MDDKDSRLFHPIFKNVVHRLQRGKQLRQFNLFPGWTVCSMDATLYHRSESICCDQCLSKQLGDNPVIHQHHALQVALMHPDIKQVIPLMAEPIQNRDGSVKQDCETNAAKRLIPQLHKSFPKMGLIITGDDLFSRQPMIQIVLENKYHFYAVVVSADAAVPGRYRGAAHVLVPRRDTPTRRAPQPAPGRCPSPGAPPFRCLSSRAWR